jgi:3'(2'), 5'-bisphosphate nucleotidase
VSVDRKRALEVALSLGQQAAQGIAGIYAGDFAVEYKEKDDPVTRADKEANAFLCAELLKAFPDVPVVAEESDPATYAGFANKPAAWFVDPLDGTREFVARNGEFCVMIGLAEHGRAVLGVLVCPALERTFVGGEGVPAYELDAGGQRKAIHVSAKADLNGARVLVSRSHLPEVARESMARLGLVTVPCGSAGVKSAKIACGEGDLYAQPGRAGNLWDACAPEAVVRAAGGVWRTFTPRRGRPKEAVPAPRGQRDGYDYARELLANDEGVISGNAALVDAVLAAEW